MNTVYHVADKWQNTSKSRIVADRKEQEREHGAIVQQMGQKFESGTGMAGVSAAESCEGPLF